jgi:hypothetical protein
MNTHEPARVIFRANFQTFSTPNDVAFDSLLANVVAVLDWFIPTVTPPNTQRLILVVCKRREVTAATAVAGALLGLLLSTIVPESFYLFLFNKSVVSQFSYCSS